MGRLFPRRPSIRVASWPPELTGEATYTIRQLILHFWPVNMVDRYHDILGVDAMLTEERQPFALRHGFLIIALCGNGDFVCVETEAGLEVAFMCMGSLPSPEEEGDIPVSKYTCRMGFDLFEYFRRRMMVSPQGNSEEEWEEIRKVLPGDFWDAVEMVDPGRPDFYV